jgi:hypothetical protein
MLIDAQAKTAIIPVKFTKEKLINLVTEQEISEISNDSLCNLVVEAYKVTDEQLLQLLLEETEVEVLPEGETLYADVDGKHIPNRLSEDSTQLMTNGASRRSVKFILESPLRMKIRGTKLPSLLDCKCQIPSLEETAWSVNHAYTVISTAFEPKRRSHTGNVFEKVTYRCKEGYWKDTPQTLGTLRNQKVMDYVSEISKRYKELKTPA